MNIINILNDKRFTLNGIQYFRNYISVVRGDRVELFNCYERRDVLVPLSHFSQFTVNGSSYDSAADLQEALIDATYSRVTGDGASGQNNTGRYIIIGPRRGVIAPSTPATLAEYVNQNSSASFGSSSLSDGFMTITESNTPVFLSSTVNVNGAYYNHIFVFTGGKGIWGSVPEGSAVTAGQFKLISVTALAPGDVESDNIISLGEIAEGSFLTAANSQTRNFTDSEKSYYLSYVTDTVLHLSLFTGEPGIYGNGSTLQLAADDFASLTNSNVKPLPNPTLEQILATGTPSKAPMVLETGTAKSKYGGDGIDYIAQSGGKTLKMRFTNPIADMTYTIPAKARNDTFAMLSDLNCWKVITISAESTAIQNNSFIGATSVDLIMANNQIFTSGYSFDPETGTISGWKVYPGEKHIIFYSKS